jgi:hypothetical protein
MYINKRLYFTVLKLYAPCGLKYFPFHTIFQVYVIHEPSIFYKTVVEKCRTAKQRITLASLYLGTGHLEEQLVKAKEIMNNSGIIIHLFF